MAPLFFNFITPWKNTTQYFTGTFQRDFNRTKITFEVTLLIALFRFFTPMVACWPFLLLRQFSQQWKDAQIIKSQNKSAISWETRSRSGLLSEGPACGLIFIFFGVVIFRNKVLYRAQRKMSILDKKLTLPADIAKGHHLFVPSEFSSPYFQFPLGNLIVHDKKKVLNNPSELCLQMLWERKENVSLLIHWRTLKLSGQ